MLDTEPTTASTGPISTSTITVFTRHSEDCSQRNPQWKRCKCRKSLYIYENGKKTVVSAKTRSWEDAEKVAQAERDKRDPVKIELARIASVEATKIAAEVAKEITLEKALEQWIGGRKTIKKDSRDAYVSTQRKILQWAASMGIKNVGDVTPEHLDLWRSAWSPKAEKKENRLALTTQVALQTRIKSFFKWATGIKIIPSNPALMLDSIDPGESDTMPLDAKQFEELIAATGKLNADMRYNAAKIGQHLRVVLLVQRWTGLRIGDALQIRKSALIGNRLKLTMQKRGNDHECVLPDFVVEELSSLPQIKGVDADCFFVSAKTKIRTETNKWVRKVKRLNKYLTFTHPKTGEPMEFRSHMLRDTYAVEMLNAGVPMEKVSKLLGHKTIASTERYYAKWVPSRLRLLEDEAVAAMRRMGVTVSPRARRLGSRSGRSWQASVPVFGTVPAP